MRHLLSKILVTMLAYMLFTIGLSSAQEIPVLTVSLPLHDIPNGVFDEFEAQHGVRVHIKADPTGPYLTSPVENVQTHLNELQAYAQNADVTFVNDYVLNGISANTGFFLDMNPLATADSDLNTANFHPAVREAYLWNGSLLALPVAFNTVVMSYNPATFDSANLNYPTGSWTIDDFASVARALTQRSADGTVIQVGYESSYYDVHLIHALAGQPLVDTMQFPATLNTNNPELARVITIWNELRAEGVIGQGDNMATTVTTMSTFPSSSFNGSGANAVLLPNNRAGLDIAGYAVSAGTQYPQLAYELVRTLTQNRAIISSHFQTYGARSSVPMQHAVSPQVQNVLNDALLATLPYQDTRYATFTRSAMQSDQVPYDLTLLDNSIQSALDIANNFGQTTALTVVPAPNLGDGVILNFGTATNALPLPNQDQWNLAVEEFVAQDDDVSWINVEGAFSTPAEYPNTYDCFALSTTRIHALDRNTILRLDPLMMSDPTFNPDDFVANTLQSNNGEIYAFPLTLSPRLLTFDTVAFDNVGIQFDSINWTLEEFITASIQWHSSMATSAFVLDDTFDVLSLVAGNGIMPIDTSTTPPTVDFTNPNTVNALRPVLDLARDNIFDYSSMVALTPMGTAQAQTPIRSTMLTSSGLGVVQTNAQFMNFPSGRESAVTSYGVLGGAISAQAEYPEACYRWLSFVSQQSYIHQSMPVRYSLLDQIQDATFSAYTEILTQPNVTVSYVGKVGSDDTFVLHYLLGQAMDNYVLNGIDLETALQSAQTNADLYIDCRAGGDTVQNCASAVAPDITGVLRS